MLRVPRKGVAFIAGFEGFRSCPYRDPVGILTVGYGTTEAVRDIDGCISERTARRWLREDLNHRFLPHVPRAHRMHPWELAALASFAYNLGIGAVSDPNNSTLARRLLSAEGKSYRGRKQAYRDEMPKWVNAGGVPLAGLVKRRAAEIRLACNADYSGHP